MNAPPPLYVPGSWGEIGVTKQRELLSSRIDRRYRVFLLVLVLVLGGHVWYAYEWFDRAIRVWSNYYLIFFTLPLTVLYLLIGVIGVVSFSNSWILDLTGPGIFALFDPALYGWFARWNQFAGWCFLLLMCLNVRPLWLLGEVSGWKVVGSPCGWSSCSRNHSALFDGVYNPNGWFPSGRFETLDTNRVERYTFCNYRSECAWADATSEPIQGFGLFPQTSLLNFDARQEPDGTLQGGYASQRTVDYPLGKGLAFGWKPATRVNRAALCPGNILTEGMHSGVQIYGLGEEICSVCHQYERGRMTKGGSRDRALNHCQESGVGTNPFCGLCPGDDGWFHNPFDALDAETSQAKHLKETVYWSVGGAFLPLVNLLVVHVVGAALRISIPNIELLTKSV